jgi:hypothetical protein
MSDANIIQAYLQYVADQQAAAEEMSPEEIEALAAQPMLTGEQANFYGMMPMYDLENDPYSLSNMLNQLQDVNQLIADPVFQGLGGPGAFSPQDFQPTVTWEQVESPEYIRWQNYKKSPNSFEGMVAAELEGGGTPFSAIQKIQAKVLEDPEGPLAQAVSALFGMRNDLGPIPGAIDWTEAGQAATTIDEMRAQIPPLGNQGQTVAPDGSIVGGGEIVESTDANGNPILLRRVEEPSPLQKEYSELGIPNPFEQYTPEMFMGPEWAAQAQAYQESMPLMQQEIAGLDQAMNEAYQAMLRNQNWTPADIPPPPEREEREQRGEGGPPPAGPGVPWEAGARDVSGIRVPAGTQPPGNYFADALAMSPEDYAQWWPGNFEQMTDQQRNNEITRIFNLATSNNPEAPRWGQVYDTIKSTFGTAEEGNIATDIAEAARDLPDLSESQRISEEAVAIATPEEFRQFVRDHPEITDYTSLQGMAMNRVYSDSANAGEWQDIANELSQGGGGGTRVQGKLPVGLTGLKTRGAEEEPPSEPIGPPAPGRERAGPFTSLDYGSDPASYDEYLAQLAAGLPTGPGRGLGVGTDALDTAYRQYIAAQNGAVPPPDYTMESATDRQQRLATTATGPPGSETAPWAPRIPGRAYNPLGGYYPLGAPAEAPAIDYTQWPYSAIAAENAANVEPGDVERAAQIARVIESRTPPDRQREAERAAMRDRLAALGQLPWYETQGVPTPGGGWASPEIAASLPGGGLTPAEIADILPGGTGRITAANYGGGPPPTGEEPRYEFPQGATGRRIRTGEERTAEERRRLARERTDEDWEYDPTTGALNMRTYTRNRFRRAFQERSNAIMERQRRADEIYGRGSGYGAAMAAVYRAQLQGASPMQQAYAQRVQNVMGAGVPLNARPQLVSY